ncbi:MAG: methionyl-tRNA formyltransferase [Oryzihumus sp.]
MMPRTVAFIGAVHEARPALQALIDHPLVTVGVAVTRPPETWARLSGAVDLAPQAAAAGIPVLHAGDARDPQVLEAVRSCRPDLLVVVGWTQLIRPELLAVPTRGCIGFHASLLPRHRGRSPVNWAILRGERVTGNTMMYLAPGADTGDIVDQVSFPISRQDTCATVYDRVGRAGAAMLTRHLPGLLDGTAPRRPQDAEAGDVLPRRTPEMGVIDWQLGADELFDWVRALTAPYPGAYTTLDGEQAMVWAAETCPPQDPPDGARPGEVVDTDGDGVLVATRDGLLRLTTLSRPGEAPQPAGEWADAVGVKPGARFDLIPRSLALWARGEGPRPVVTS